MAVDEFLDLVLQIHELKHDEILKKINQLDPGIDKSCLMMIYLYYVNSDTLIETGEEFLNITQIEKDKILHYFLGVLFARWWLPTSRR